MQRLIRTIVLSATYSQNANFRPELQDPENRLLARGPSFRLPAETIRDQALAVSGLLSREVGGPSVKPYQPEGIWEDLSAPPSHAETYVQGQGRDLYRKSFYTYWRRSVTHPLLSTFDAPSREVCTADRFQSNSPQQALTLLNDPTFVEAARGFALRVSRENPASTDAVKIAAALRLALAREPKPAELASLTKFLSLQRDYYRSKPDDAVAFLKTGLSDPGNGQDPAELAAWSQLCRVILNLHETITRY